MPELGLELPETTKYIMKVLDKLGIEYHTLVDGNAIVGIICGNGKGKIIGVRADMDALPIKEETGLPFVSTNGCMHACGHDGHIAMLLGAVRILNENKNMINGYVILSF